MKNSGATSKQLDKLWGDILTTAQKNYLRSDLSQGGLASLADVDFDFSKTSNEYNKGKAYLEQYNDELDKLVEGTDEYNAKLAERDAAARSHAETVNKLIDDGSELRALFGESESFTETDYNAVRDTFEFVNGQLIIDADKFEKLTETQKAALKSQVKNLEEYGKKQKDYADELTEVYETLAQSQIDAEKRAAQAQIDELEKRKEALEAYFNEIDALDEESDRATQKDSLVTQIAALTGALDGSSKSKIKELQQQLRNLQEEELQAQKQNQRDALLKTIDDEVERLNNVIDNLSDKLHEYTEAIRASIEGNKSGGKKYAKGGMVNYTGPAWVDGTPTNPEAFLSATDVRLIQDLVSSLRLSPVENSNSNINIDRIDIHTDHLDNNQDFANAGETLADAFSNAIRRRGINTNARK